MINLLLGAPGGGKSYEAVTYHVIPALSEGRKVITNLPLLLDAFPPEWRSLLDVRVKTVKPVPVVDWQKAESMFQRFGFAHREPKYNANAFANVEDYGQPTENEETGLIQFVDSWRHPETGAGALYVIDECHKALPALGTPVAVEQWFAEHRHGYCDVLLMTQSHGKINKSIKELVQVCYRVRKATHLGFSNRYVRKVLDGVNGTEMNESVREYDPAFFKFYRSHTQSSAAGSELGAKDVKPIWKHWTFKCAAVLVPLSLIGMYLAGNPMSAKTPPKKQVVKAAPAPVSKIEVPVAEKPEAPPVKPTFSNSSGHPLAGLGLHIAGYLESESHSMYLFTVSQNGQAVYTMNEHDLRKSGYSIRGMNDCIAEISFEAAKFYVNCDSPRIGVTPSASMPAAKS